jgi:hypothetical protein
VQLDPAVVELIIIDPPSIELGRERGSAATGLTMFGLSDFLRGLLQSPATAAQFTVLVATDIHSCGEVSLMKVEMLLT